MQELPRKAYEVDFAGNIFVLTRTDIADEKGAVTHVGMTHRAPYQPGDDLPEDDEKLAAIAGAVWTEEQIATGREVRAEAARQIAAAAEKVREGRKK